jgi:hypothetical protein
VELLFVGYGEGDGDCDGDGDDVQQVARHSRSPYQTEPRGSNYRLHAICVAEAVSDGINEEHGTTSRWRESQAMATSDGSAQCYIVPKRCVPAREVSRMMRPLDEASLGRGVP